jgi:uncharacterized protein DUF6297
VASRRFRLVRFGRAWVLLQAELRRLARRPGAAGAWAGLVLAQYAVALALPGAAGITRAVGTYLAAERLAGGLRAVCRSPGLRRALGGSDGELRATHLVVPAAGAVAWWLATWPTAPHRAPLVDALVVAGAVLGVYRAATRPPMSYDGVVLDTPMGPVPIDLIRQLTRGPDVLALVVVIQAFG